MRSAGKKAARKGTLRSCTFLEQVYSGRMSLEWAQYGLALHARVTDSRSLSLATAATLTSWIRKALGHRPSASTWSQISERRDAAGVFYFWKKKGHSGHRSFPSCIAGRVFPRRNFISHKGNFNQYAFMSCIGKHAAVNFLSCTGMIMLNSRKPNQKSTGCVSPVGVIWSVIWVLECEWPREATGVRIGSIWREEHCLLDTQQN